MNSAMGSPPLLLLHGHGHHLPLLLLPLLPPLLLQPQGLQGALHREGESVSLLRCREGKTPNPPEGNRSLEPHLIKEVKNQLRTINKQEKASKQLSPLIVPPLMKDWGGLVIAKSMTNRKVDKGLART